MTTRTTTWAPALGTFIADMSTRSNEVVERIMLILHDPGLVVALQSCGAITPEQIDAAIALKREMALVDIATVALS